MNRLKRSSMYFTLFFSFLLGSYRGYIALWLENSPKPAEVFPYRVSMLPPADQQSLENGIPIESEQELARLLEDYLS